MEKIWIDRDTVEETVEVKKVYSVQSLRTEIEFQEQRENEAKKEKLRLKAILQEILSLPNRPSK